MECTRDLGFELSISIGRVRAVLTSHACQKERERERRRDGEKERVVPTIA